MRVYRGCFYSAATVLLLMCVTSTFAVPTYMPVSSSYSDYATGYAEVYNNGPSYGLNYGKAKIEWHYWRVDEWWYYAYRVYNNEAGIPNNRTDDYHFGHIYDSGTYTPINSWSIDFPVELPGEYGSSNALYVLSTSAGSSRGGGAWSPLVDQEWKGGNNWVMTGVDWSATRGGATGWTIDPTQWDLQRIKGQDTWVLIYSGDTSRYDAANWEYFEIASYYMPGLVNVDVSNGLVSSNTMIGEVYGPAIVPEPTTCLLLGLGFLGLSSSRRRI